ncbi:MAG: homoserine O-succinyltransferase [Paramuribaculum sp.]|nr:homoserine O-succinyltransferase [Paramuribaculum sp.]MDE7151717.1 homoserine O-succinyltransferase [Candidatus Amulumruptor sp.]
MSLILPQGLPSSTAAEGLAAPDVNGSLEISLVNLMPLKEMTEADFIRLLAPAPYDITLSLAAPVTHRSRNTAEEHIARFYISPEEMLSRSPDGVIVTGAPVEMLDYEAVDYWPELTTMMDGLRRLRIPVIYICWGAMAALYHHYGIAKQLYRRKISGVFPQYPEVADHELFRGMEAPYMVPNSRYCGVSRADIDSNPWLRVAAVSEESGVYMVDALDAPEHYILGHSEYAPGTLDFEYHRDLAKGINPSIPANYYPDNDPDREPVDRWHSHAVGLFSNWLRTLPRR